MNTLLIKGGYGRVAIALIFRLLYPVVYIITVAVWALPWRVKHAILESLWIFWRWLHRDVLPYSFRRGASADLSVEAHALHNLMWFGRLVPMTIHMMRFGLAHLSIGELPGDTHVTWVDAVTPGLRSLYIHLCPASEKSPRVLLWAFGGAYLSGDIDGNRGIAEGYGRRIGCDVFLVDMRLCPESTVEDALFDLYHGYAWLINVKKVAPENIVMYGISSGGGSVLRMLQLCQHAGDTERKEMLGSRSPLPPALPQPAGAILIGPFVDAENIEENMTALSQYDWIVSQSVLELVDDDLKRKMTDDYSRINRVGALSHTMTGICPIMISTSEHECLFPESCKIVESLKAAGVDVTFSTRPYLCHVYQLFAHYLPEAAAEKEKICDWVRSLGGAWARRCGSLKCVDLVPALQEDGTTSTCEVPKDLCVAADWSKGPLSELSQIVDADPCRDLRQRFDTQDTKCSRSKF
jgi:acetyl esterase/lipase